MGNGNWTFINIEGNKTDTDLSNSLGKGEGEASAKDFVKHAFETVDYAELKSTYDHKPKL